MKHLVIEIIPADPRPAMWLTGLMCGLRPGELAGLRWPFVDIDSDSPSIHVVERALEVEDRYMGQAEPKTPRAKRRIVSIRCSSPPSAGTARTCGRWSCTTTRASCSVRATARR